MPESDIWDEGDGDKIDIEKHRQHWISMSIEINCNIKKEVQGGGK